MGSMALASTHAQVRMSAHGHVSAGRMDRPTRAVRTHRGGQPSSAAVSRAMTRSSRAAMRSTAGDAAADVRTASGSAADAACAGRGSTPRTPRRATMAAADRVRALADAPGEHDRVQPIEAGGRRRDARRDAPHEHRQRQARGLGSPDSAAVHDRAHVRGACDRQQAGAMIEGIREGGQCPGGRRRAVAAGCPDRPNPRGCPSSGPRAASSPCSCPPSVRPAPPSPSSPSRGGRPRGPGWSTGRASRRRGTARGPRHGQAVEAEPAHPEPVVPVAGEGIAPRGLRQRGVEGGVEAGDVRHVGKRRPGRLDGVERDTVVERRQVAHRADAVEHRGIDPRWRR